jgi:hypothetical protein
MSAEVAKESSSSSTKKKSSRKHGEKKSSRSGRSKKSAAAASSSSARSTSSRKTKHKHKIGAHKRRSGASKDAETKEKEEVPSGFSGTPKISESEIVLIEKKGEGCFGTVWAGKVCLCSSSKSSVLPTKRLKETNLIFFSIFFSCFFFLVFFLLVPWCQCCNQSAEASRSNYRKEVARVSCRG